MKRFALAGNPNCGKTTLFNSLTGSTAHVGNWPGVTVDKKEGTYKKCAEPISIVDLPGIYSLSPYTPEEVISRNYILEEKPDCVINIVDATNLERNLYLTTQIMEIDVPMIIALNMMDTVEKNGDKIDAKSLEEKIGLPVVEISALREKGLDELMQRAGIVLRCTDSLVGKFDFTEKVFEREGKLSVVVSAALRKIVVFLSAAHAAVDSVRRKFFDFFAPHVRRGLTDFCKEGIYAHVELIGKHAEIKGFQSLIRS